MLAKIAVILGILTLAACAPAVATRLRKPQPSGDARRELDELVRSKPELSILFIGNSYSFGVPRELEKLAASRGRTIRTGHSTSSGWSLSRHATHEPTLRKIRSGKWDIVVLQEYSLTPAQPVWKLRQSMFPPLRLLAAEARKAGAIPILYQTWGRRDTFLEMNRKVRAGYHAAAKNAGGLIIVPAGDYWEEAVRGGRLGDLFLPDGSHPTAEGDRRTAEAFFTVLYR